MLVASVIARNELGRYLELHMPHLLSFCDRVRVLDDHSDDGTREWLEQQDRVDVKASTSPPMYEYESEARNELIDWTLQCRPTWVLSIDADEFVSRPDLLNDALAHGGARVYTLSMIEVWGADENGLRIRVDGQWGPRKCPILWRAPSSFRGQRLWKVPDRKLACGREPLKVRSGPNKPSGAEVLHWGWTRRSERLRRFQRYEKHDQGNYHADAHLQSIMWPDEQVRTVAHEWPESVDREAMLSKIAE